MAVEAPIGPNPAELVAQHRPELDPAIETSQLLDKIAPLINTQLNEAIGHDVESARAWDLANPLLRAQDALTASDEIRQFEAGTLARESLSENALKALDEGQTSGGLLDLAKTEIGGYEAVEHEQGEALDFDRQLGEARENYVGLLMSRPRLRGKKEHGAKLAGAETAYNEALLNKIAKLLELDPGHDKMPYSRKVAEELRKTNPDIKELSGNHLHVLVDQLSREQLLKAKAIEARTGRGAKRVFNALRSSRALRVAVGGALWVGSLAAANKGLLPDGAEFIGEGAETVLPLVAGYFTSREVFAGIDEGVEKFGTRRRMKREIDQLTNDTFATDLALRTVYSNIEYQNGRITARRAGETKVEHKAAIGNIDSEFRKLEQEGHREGKPYDADTVMGRVNNLFLRRRDKVEAIVGSDDPKAAFLELCNEVIVDDTAALTERQKNSRARRAAYRALSVCYSVFASQWISQMSDLQGASMRPVKMAKLETI